MYLVKILQIDPQCTLMDLQRTIEDRIARSASGTRESLKVPKINRQGLKIDEGEMKSRLMSSAKLNPYGITVVSTDVSTPFCSRLERVKASIFMVIG